MHANFSDANNAVEVHITITLLGLVNLSFLLKLLISSSSELPFLRPHQPTLTGGSPGIPRPVQRCNLGNLWCPGGTLLDAKATSRQGKAHLFV